MSKGGANCLNQILTSVSVEMLLLTCGSGFFFISSAFVSPEWKFCPFALRLGVQQGWFVSGTTSDLVRWSNGLLDATQMSLNICPWHPLIACQWHLFLWLACSWYSKDSELCGIESEVGIFTWINADTCPRLTQGGLPSPEYSPVDWPDTTRRETCRLLNFGKKWVSLKSVLTLAWREFYAEYRNHKSGDLHFSTIRHTKKRG